MAKKFGKILLFTAAIGSAAAAVYYYVHKKHAEQDNIEEEDYDDFSDDTEEDSDASRSYVPLSPEGAQEQEAPAAQEDPAEEAFSPLKESAAKAAEATEETVEAFFNEEDASDEEPPVIEN